MAQELTFEAEWEPWQADDDPAPSIYAVGTVAIGNWLRKLALNVELTVYSAAAMRAMVDADPEDGVDPHWCVVVSLGADSEVQREGPCASWRDGCDQARAALPEVLREWVEQYMTIDRFGAQRAPAYRPERVFSDSDGNPVEPPSIWEPKPPL